MTSPGAERQSKGKKGKACLPQPTPALLVSSLDFQREAWVCSSGHEDLRPLEELRASCSDLGSRGHHASKLFDFVLHELLRSGIGVVVYLLLTVLISKAKPKSGRHAHFDLLAVSFG